MKTSTFSYTEEAFLLCSLHKVVKVWAGGFDLKIDNGVAHLNLGFQLGHPASLHCDPPQHQPYPGPVPGHHGQQPHHRRRKKGPSRSKRDKLRTEMHTQKKKDSIA
jgi:hypothetical protein